MNKYRILTFLILSIIIHFFLIFYWKSEFFLFSNIQNIKLKKDITKVKLIKIIEKPKEKIKPKLKPTPKPLAKVVEEKLKQIKIPEEKPKIKKQEKKIVEPPKPKPKPKKTKPKPPKVEKKIDLSVVKKKIERIKEREKKKERIKKRLEEQKRVKEKLKREAAIFYSNKIVSLIQSLWVFPKVIKDSELPNLEIKIKLRVNKEGKIVGKPVVLDKSNNEIFNESALRAIEKLSKYKIPLPDVIDEKYLDIVITLTPPNM